MVSVILSWLGTTIAAGSSAFLLRGPANSKFARYLSVIGMVSPLIGAIAFGPTSKAFMLLIPIGLIMSAGGALLYSKLEPVEEGSRRIYAAAIVAIVGFSIAGWAIVLSQR